MPDPVPDLLLGAWRRASIVNDDGTQFELVDERRRPRPIENPETVDERREALGMRSLKAYTKFANT